MNTSKVEPSKKAPTPADADGLIAQAVIKRSVRARKALQEPPEQAHVMVDVETMGVKPGCAVLSIGAVRFDPHQAPQSLSQGKHLQGQSHFYMVINSLDSSTRGFSSDPDTMRWWKKQSIWAQLSMAIMQSDTTVPQAARRFKEFLDQSHQGGGVKLWANSPSFDIAILRSMFKAVDQDFPVNYRQEMDYRTLMELVYPHRLSRPERPVALAALPMHHALGDAAAQAHHLIIASQSLGISQLCRQNHDAAPREQASQTGQASGCHMMLEVKTLGRSKGSAILSIAAVIFDPTARRSIEQDPNNQFHVVLSSFDMGNFGFGSDPDTVRWWKSQAVWPSLCMESVRSGVPLARALRQLSEFIGAKNPHKVWANSPTFDIDMLRDAYTATRLPFPIEYRQEMDYRTVMDMVYADRSNRPQAQGADGLPAHHALGDAVGQSRVLVEALGRLRLDLDALASPKQPASPRPGYIASESDVGAVEKRKTSFRLR